MATCPKCSLLFKPLRFDWKGVGKVKCPRCREIFKVAVKPKAKPKVKPAIKPVVKPVAIVHEECGTPAGDEDFVKKWVMAGKAVKLTFGLYHCPKCDKNFRVVLEKTRV